MITSTMNPVQEFLNKAKQDIALGQQIETAQKQNTKESINEIVRLAANYGINFTAKQYQQYIRNCQKQSAAPRSMSEAVKNHSTCGTR